MDDGKRKRGRPRGRRLVHVRALRLGDVDAERLRLLSEKLELPEGAVIRQAIKEKAEREKVHPIGGTGPYRPEADA